MTTEEINYAIKRTKQIIEFGGYKPYSEYSFLCGCSNENQEAISKVLDYKNKDILTVAASGEQYFSSKFYGAKNVTLYDINNLAKLYVYLKIGAMKSLDYEKYMSFLVSKENKNYLSINTLLKISDYIPDYISKYWYYILKNFNYYQLEKLILYPTDFKGEPVSLKPEPYYTQENYEKLKKIIENEKYPKFISSSIYNIAEKINEQKFDVIDTSNIIECILRDSWEFDCYNDDIITNWISLIENKLAKLLNENGQIIVDYVPSNSSNPLVNNKSFKKYKINSKINNSVKSMVLVYKNKNH